MFEEKLEEFEPIFHPKSIAVIGASANEAKMGSMWVKGLISSGFEGRIYPVSRSGGSTLGLKIFPNLRAIPEEVDYVIVSIPRQRVLELLDDCITKKVKAVHFFTAGFSELAKPEGRDLEEQMVRKGRQGNFRIIGPNCIGTYCPESKVPLISRIGVSGSVGFISQSGGLADKLAEFGIARHINFSKGVSFGNGIDLDASDFLQYLTADPKTTIIGAYLEGTRNGRRLFDTMKKAAQVKPVIVWKGGKTEVGAEAAMSHTGSLASSAAIWSAALKQSGAIEVQNLEELADTLLIFQQLGHWKGNNVAVMGGVGGGGGGISVSASDACTENGVNMPPISSKTRDELLNLMGEVGTILRNPIDLSQSLGGGFSTLSKAIELVVADPIIELIIIQEDVDILLSYLSQGGAEMLNKFLIDLRNRQSKPLVLVLPPGSAEPERLKAEEKLLSASIPVFPTMERAAKAIARSNQYFSSRQEIPG